VGKILLLAVAALVGIALLVFVISSSPWFVAGFAFLGLGLVSRRLFG
jgi:hypothetical protein